MKDKNRKDIYTAHCQKGGGKGKDVGMPASEGGKKKTKKEKKEETQRKKEEIAAPAAQEQSRQTSQAASKFGPYKDQIKKLGLCWFYQLGNCKFGNQCKSGKHKTYQIRAASADGKGQGKDN